MRAYRETTDGGTLPNIDQPAITDLVFDTAEARYESEERGNDEVTTMMTRKPKGTTNPQPVRASTVFARLAAESLNTGRPAPVAQAAGGGWRWPCLRATSPSFPALSSKYPLSLSAKDSLPCFVLLLVSIADSDC